MTDTEPISNSALESQAAVMDQPVQGIPATARALHVPGRKGLAECLPNPAAARKIDGEAQEHRHQGALCRFAVEELRAGGRIEQRVWIVLSVSSVVTILYAAYWFLFQW